MSFFSCPNQFIYNSVWKYWFKAIHFFRACLRFSLSRLWINNPLVDSYDKIYYRFWNFHLWWPPSFYEPHDFHTFTSCATVALQPSKFWTTCRRQVLSARCAPINNASSRAKISFILFHCPIQSFEFQANKFYHQNFDSFM